MSSGCGRENQNPGLFKKSSGSYPQSVFTPSVTKVVAKSPAGLHVNIAIGLALIRVPKRSSMACRASSAVANDAREVSMKRKTAFGLVVSDKKSAGLRPGFRANSV